MTDEHPSIVDPAHYGPEGPVAVAFQFLEAVFHGEKYGDHWALLDDNLRLCRVQGWLWNNRTHPNIEQALEDEGVDLDGLAAEMVEGRPEWLWETFVRVEVDQMQENWLQLYERDLGAASHTRILGPDVELILLVATDGKGPIVYDEDTTLTSEDTLQIPVRHVEGRWRIAGYWPLIPEPGWPPRFTPDS